MPPLKKKVLCKVCRCVTENADGYCDEHRDKKKERCAETLFDRHRGSPSSRGYDYRWTKFRTIYLREHPLCVMCEKEGRLTPAVEIHHVKMLRDGGDKFNDDNLMALCHSCHSKITAKEAVHH